MARFLLGLLLGLAAGAITWAVSHHAGLAVLIGLGVALLVWVGHRIIDDLLGAIGDLLS